MKATRLNQIETLLEEQNTISLDELCEKFGVSKNTIRRDVIELEKRGSVQKVYGGITRNQNSAPEPFFSREIKNKITKREVARLAASLIDDNDVIYIDSGTTTMHIVPFLANKKHITILTGNVYVINEALNYPDINLISTGGTLYRPSNSFVGANVVECLSEFNISKAFLAATGISLENGATNVSPLEGDIKKYVVQHSKMNVLMVDSTKMDTVSLVTFANLEDFTYVVSDSKLSTAYQDYLKAHNVKLLTD